MKFWKQMLLLALAGCLMIALTACGGGKNPPSGGENEPDQSSAQQTQPSAPSAPSGERKVIIAGTGLTDTHYGTVSLEKMKEYLEEHTDSLTVEIYPNNAIGNDKDVLEAIQYGTATLNIPTPAVMANFVPAYNLLSLPFIFEDAEAAHELLDGDWGRKLRASAESAGFQVLGIGDYGFRQLTSGKKEIKSLADYAGMKIRVMQNDLHIATYEALGANPTPMASGEVFTALQQKVVDGQENPLSNIYSQKFNEVQSFILKDNHVCDFLVFAFSKEFYDGLTPEEQTALQEAVDLAVAYTREQCAATDAECEAIMAKDMTITEITPDFRAECVAAVESIWDEFGNAADAELYAEMLAALN